MQQGGGSMLKGLGTTIEGMMAAEKALLQVG
jgi:hypothetical protein